MDTPQNRTGEAALTSTHYREIPLIRSPEIKQSYLLKLSLLSLSYSFLYFLHPVYLWLKTTFGTVQKWSLRPLLNSLKGGLNTGILLYLCVWAKVRKIMYTHGFPTFPYIKVGFSWCSLHWLVNVMQIRSTRLLIK